MTARLRRHTLALSLVLAGIVVVLAPSTPAYACSCAEVAVEDVASRATFAFVGTELGRQELVTNDWPNVQVFFAVDAWLSHADGPAEVAVMTGTGGGDCGVGPLQGQVAVFAHGSFEQPGIDSCGSIWSPEAAAAAFEGVAVPEYPIPYASGDPETAPSSSSYTDIVLPALGVAGLVIGLGAALAMRSRRRDDAQIT